MAELAELDGPFVKISLRGRFWHKRSTVIARLGNFLKQRIPVSLKIADLRNSIELCNDFVDIVSQEILEVDIEDEKQLDDSPENF